MSDFVIKHGRKQPSSRFAIGRNSGSLFLMATTNKPNDDRWEAFVIIGRGPLADQTGKHHRAYPYLFDLLPVGTIIEIEA